MNLKKTLSKFPEPVKVVDSEIDLGRQLNSLIAEEYIAWLQYFQFAHFLVGVNRPSLEEEFKKHAEEELSHADKLLNRLNELKLEPCQVKGPDDWYNWTSARCNLELFPTVPAQALYNRDLEEAAINHYKEVISALGDTDPVTTDLLKEILADEEAHYIEMQEFVDDFNEQNNEY